MYPLILTEFLLVAAFIIITFIVRFFARQILLLLSNNSECFNLFIGFYFIRFVTGLTICWLVHLLFDISFFVLLLCSRRFDNLIRKLIKFFNQFRHLLHKFLLTSIIKIRQLILLRTDSLVLLSIISYILFVYFFLLVSLLLRWCEFWLILLLNVNLCLKSNCFLSF